MKLGDRLKAVECRQSTDVQSDFFISRSQDSFVWNQHGEKFFDLTSGFSVCNLGHNPSWLNQILHQQIDQVSHVLGDIAPHPLKSDVLEKLTQMFGFDQGFIGVTGSDAIDFALKTAVLLKPQKEYFVTFEGSYHGLSRWPLGTTNLAPFRSKFNALTINRKCIIFPQTDTEMETFKSQIASAAKNAFAIITEPIQGRAGERFPHPMFLKTLRETADQFEIPLIIDEIYTGFYRTGKLLATDVRPDILCLGKALGNSMPISAVLADQTVMDVWPENQGEALHTGTFMGHALSLASANATLDYYQKNAKEIQANVCSMEMIFKSIFHDSKYRIRGALGAIDTSENVTTKLLSKGILGLPCGTGATGIGICPTLTTHLNIWQETCETIKMVVSDGKIN